MNHISYIYYLFKKKYNIYIYIIYILYMDFFDEQVGGSRVCSARAQKGQEMMVHNPADAEVKKALVRTKRPKNLTFG